MPDWSLRAASADDAHWIAELRAVVLHADLERLGRFDPVRVRQRFLSAFDAEVTQVVVADDRDAGSIAVRRAGDAVWIEHFYLSPELQGRGVGSAVLRSLLASTAAGVPFRLNVLQGSRARALYERNGFIVESEDPVDVFMVRPRVSPHA
jgi:GNAT superfamily N-acetyltransferase